MTAMKPVVKCRLCEWESPAWVTTRKGKRVNCYTRLQQHFRDAHPEEADKIEKQVQAMTNN